MVRETSHNRKKATNKNFSCYIFSFCRFNSVSGTVTLAGIFEVVFDNTTATFPSTYVANPSTVFDFVLVRAVALTSEAEITSNAATPGLDGTFRILRTPDALVLRFTPAGALQRSDARTLHPFAVLLGLLVALCFLFA